MNRTALVLLLPLLLLLGLPPFADGAERTLRGRVVDAEGKGVAGIEVATAWTIDAGGATPRKGVKTDADGRFSLPRPSSDSEVTVVAYDAARARGAIVAIDPKAVANEPSLSLAPTVRVTGALSAVEGKHYPADGVCFVATAKDRAYPIRVEPEKGKFSAPLPPGSYVLTAQAPGRRTQSIDVVVAAGKPELALAKLELQDHDGRVEIGDLAPPIRVKVGHPRLDETLEASHFPDRWTLFYFWDFT